MEAKCKVIEVLGSMREYNTMKIRGKLENIDVVVLVDSRASHNFVSSKLTSALGLCITPMKLGDEHKVLSQGACKGVKVNLGSMEVMVDGIEPWWVGCYSGSFMAMHFREGDDGLESFHYAVLACREIYNFSRTGREQRQTLFSKFISGRQTRRIGRRVVDVPI